jgi:hypothetical protein
VREQETAGKSGKREAAALLEVEKERAKRRQAEQAKVNQPQAKQSQKQETNPASEKSQARDSVGEKVGVSGLTAQRAAFCVAGMDALEKLGKTTIVLLQVMGEGRRPRQQEIHTRNGTNLTPHTSVPAPEASATLPLPLVLPRIFRAPACWFFATDSFARTRGGL